jgi:hypothetical protein
MGPHVRVFPACSVAEPSADERVSVIYGYSGQALSSVSVGGDETLTEVVDVEIGAAEKPHYIALSSGKAVIWRFSGRVETVSRVVVLGAQLSGAERAGVIGIPKERIRFVIPNYDALKRVQATSCHSFYFACELSAYFAIPKADRMQLAEAPPDRRLAVDQFVERFRADIVRIPEDGTVEDEFRGRFEQLADGAIGMTGAARGRYEPFSGTDVHHTNMSHERGVISVAPGDVVSTEAAKSYDVLPAWAGINQLIADGTLLDPSSSRFKDSYEKWDAAISESFRTRLDPQFRFAHKVDYLITRPTRIPAGLSGVAMLVDDGVDAPATKGMGFKTCVFFADQREFKVDRTREIDPRCDQYGGSISLPERQRRLVSMQSALERLKSGEKIQTVDCRVGSVAGDAYFAALALSEGPAWRGGAMDTSRRRVDVVVKRPGRIALYLEMWGGRTDWHIIADPGSEIAAVLLGSLSLPSGEGDRVFGPFDPSRLQQLRPKGGQPCVTLTPSRYAHLGGPAAIVLDESLKRLVGRGLDRLVKEINSGDWPPVTDNDGRNVSFVVE